MSFRNRVFSALLSVVLVFAFMPTIVFANSSNTTKAEAKKDLALKQTERAKDNKNLKSDNRGTVKAQEYSEDYDYDSEYSGKPSITTVDYTDDDGSLSYYYSIEPNAGDSISVNTEDGPVEYKWIQYDDEGYFERPDNPDDWLYVWGIDLWDNNTKAEMYVTNRVWDENEGEYIEKWTALVPLNRFDFKNTVSKISFTPANINLVADDIISYEDGMPYYSFWKRSIHNEGGREWNSPYAVGDKLTVYYINGITQTFTNQNIQVTDYDDDYYYDYYDDYFKNGDYHLWASLDNDTLTLGNNTITISWHGVKTTINVVVETAAEKAAREKAAAEKAAAEKAAAEKAAAEKAAAEKAAREKAAAEAKMKGIKNITINKATVNAKTINNAITAAGGSKKYVTKFVLGKKVKKISKSAFKDTNVTTIEVKTKKLRAKSVKGSLKESKVKKIVIKVGKSKVNKKYKKSYKKIFTKKNVGKKVSIK